MSEHGEMVKLLSRTLTGNDSARRRAEHDRDLDRRNELARDSVGLVSAASPRVLHSLVLSWMLDRTRLREELAGPGMPWPRRGSSCGSGAWTGDIRD